MTVPIDREQKLDAWLALTGQSVMLPGLVQLPLLTGSMAATIPVGALLTIDPHGPPSCQAGDIAVFLEDGHLVAHRILLVLRAGTWDWLLEKGDNNPRGRWRSGSTVCGKVVDFAEPGKEPHGNPADAALASRGLRQHIRHCILNFGRKAANPKAQEHDSESTGE